MRGIFVNENEYPYAQEICLRLKTIETRSKNMLRSCVGERVAVICTRANCYPLVLGYVDITEAHRKNWVFLDHNRSRTRIPVGSKFDTPIRWCYFLANATPCSPYPLPANAVRHGRSWCEWEDGEDF